VTHPVLHSALPQQLIAYSAADMPRPHSSNAIAFCTAVRKPWQLLHDPAMMTAIKTGVTMSLIVPIKMTDLGPGEQGTIAPERLLAGEPVTESWPQDIDLAGKVDTGVWQITPSENISIKDGICEFCLILEGVVELTADTGESWTFRKGDAFVMKDGWRGKWKTIETVRKLYVTISK
jgi:uncharacterized cupin superfamily protein